MGFRFQNRISILPGVRINLSKSGASASLGPRGADVNIGRDGVTTNAGIPGTGLSYRQKVGKGGKTGWFGILALVAGLGFLGFQHAGKIQKGGAVRPADKKMSTGLSTASSTEPSTDAPSTSATPTNAAGNMQRY